MPASEDELLRELLGTFQAEATEHLQTLNRALLQLERQPEEARRAELLRDAFRAAHSLKGAARAVSLTDIEGLAHAMENVLQKARDANLLLDAATCDMLYDTLDTIEQALQGEKVTANTLQQRLSGAASVMPEAAPTLLTRPEREEDREIPVAARTGEETIRVAVSKLDELMAQAGELLVSKISAEQRLAELEDIRRQLAQWPRAWREIKALLAQVNGHAGQQLQEALTRLYEGLQTLTRAINALDQAVNNDTLRLGMITTQLQDEVRRVRMVPFQTLALSLERAVRDAAHGEGKQVHFQIDGSDVEVDKKVLETLKDPLLHLLRNAVSHGIEPPEERTAAGKPAEGHINVTIRQRGSEVRIVVSDDGRGFDLEALRKASARAGGPVLDADARPDEVIALAFIPGVTTAPQVTTMAGRGVGLDVVRQQLAGLQGRIEVESVPGAGSTFRLAIPASLTMTRGLLVQVGQRRYVLPLLAVEKILPPHKAFSLEGQPMLSVDDTPLPLVSLGALLDHADAASNANGHSLAVIIGVVEQRLALLVDDVLTEQEVAVKPLGAPLKRVRNVAGAALLGDGRPIIVLNPADLVKSARRVRSQALPTLSAREEDTSPPGHILVVDDSITTRTLEKNILETAGYRVTTATNGVEALRQLDENHIDLVVADIQMPQMDGITLTRHIRESAEYKALPVILVTSLESREDRERGMLAGADAYIVKRGFDQAELLATIEHFLS